MLASMLDDDFHDDEIARRAARSSRSPTASARLAGARRAPSPPSATS